jgi:Rps23 Pro-64 3,4-dihydroxylase Tpa1-like proline 4-hydroxylase
MNKNDFNKDGYKVIDDFLPEDLAIKLYDIFESQSNDKWKLIDQVRENHYGHVFKTKNKLLPKKNESYTAKFARSEDIESLIDFKEIISNQFTTKIREMVSESLTEFDTRAYRLDRGDHYRTHIDSYGGNINIIYYLNTEWIWDWGGILNICSDKDEDYCKPIFPKFNRLVLLNNKKFHSPHFISPVNEFALNPRFSIVIFAS